MSEWGQINSGQTYGVLCVDIDRALAHMWLSSLEQMLVQYVREHSWGVATIRKGRGKPWPESKPCDVNLSQLAALWGVSRERLTKAKNNLIDLRVFLDSTAGIEINKEVHTWRGLSDQALAYARSGITPTVTEASQCMDPPTVTEASQGCDGSVTGGVTLPSHPHVEERARQKISEEIKKKPEGARPASVVEQVVRDIFRLTDDHGDPDPNVCGQLRAWTAKQSEAAVIAAAHKAVREATGDPVKFFIGMCRKGLDDPEKAPPPRASPNGKPDPPIEYHVAPPEAKNRRWTMGGKR